MQISHYTLELFLIIACFCLQALAREVDTGEKPDKPKDQIILDGKELGPVLQVQKLIRLGKMEEALKMCNQIIQANPHNRYARLERARTYESLGQISKSEEDLDYLLKKYPDFEPAYLKRARQLLRVPIPKEGEHPLIKWMRSSNQHKQRAALAAVQEVISKVSESPEVANKVTVRANRAKSSSEDER